jgi:hypothetical protein
MQFEEGKAMRERERKHSMPNPKECRQRAFEYVWLAQAAAFLQEREAYFNLAKIWLRLANDLGNSQRLVEERNDLQYKKAS